ncbi:hypothetical protein J3Q64DRAFT_1869249 [Phycomyces blakesleeanus]|uniref:NFACT RNA-binding domain-containing protein n=1 Tax=Phycomyces blakesleeanus TaxID=4837 RepID=A0ABR3BCA2_PHYBL
MVLYFKSNVVDPPVTIYMGRDKFENEDLIKYGFPEDVWYFHVDKLSSAHVYVRLQPGQTWLDIPEAVVEDCAQLVKANSIEGNKKNNVTIIYTPWDNLKKTPGMETGQVTFFNHKKVKRVIVHERINAIVNRLNKTKDERQVDLMEEKIQRDKIDRKAAREEEFKENERIRLLALENRKAQQEISNLFDEGNMRSNQRPANGSDDSDDDFM